MPHAQMQMMQMLRRACSTSRGVSRRASCTSFIAARCQQSLPPGASSLSRQSSACGSLLLTNQQMHVLSEPYGLAHLSTPLPI